MRVPGKRVLRQSARWARSRFGSGALILGYHRVAEVTDDAYSICVQPGFFAEQLAVLKRYAQLITLDDLTQGLHTGNLPPRSVAITFDDGYADNLYQAKPLLEHYEVPATLFVASGYLGQRFWWDELATMVLNSEKLPDRLTVDRGGEINSWSLADLGEKRRVLLQQIYQYLLGLEDEDRQQAMAELSDQIGANLEQLALDNRALTAEELIELASDGLVTIGAHTVSHPVLTNLTEEYRQQEIEQSKQHLETLLDKPVVAFSYPNGVSDEYIRKLVRSADYTCACNSFKDVVRPGTDPFNLPRFWVPNQNGQDFSHWLRRWLVS